MADDVLETLKTDTLNDLERSSLSRPSLGPSPWSVSPSSSTSARRSPPTLRTPRAVPGASGMDVDQNGDRIREIDDELGMAVVFDEGEYKDQYEVRDENDEREEGQEAQVSGCLTTRASGGGSGEDNDDKNRITAQREELIPHDIDAFWLQRIVASYYPDPHTAQEKTATTMCLLEFDGINTSDCENELMGLFNYDKSELAKILTRHREIIVSCTRLERAGTSLADGNNIGTQMRERDLDWTPRDLGDEPAKRGVGRASSRTPWRSPIRSSNAAQVGKCRCPARKTIVIMLTILHEIGKNGYGRYPPGRIRDCVYIVPVKALIQEMVANFGTHPKPYGVNVAELAGDRQN
ncbi:hypothetical protein BC938DRAFT_475818 [Jimgerdemannia flammicorona]|uniref:Brr2 N-terminal helicase PWI domain-containing protein n=1 Tax=Jimgerdemannia flammicorona TaxID=994334 RepID=A0A433QR63_9FUNG|nr:hypothetical protein BC938DRAFT_475818 [Jimgerdemannia flammicorona]